MVGGQQKNKTRQDNLVELEASLAPAGAEVGAVAKADQYQITAMRTHVQLFVLHCTGTWRQSGIRRGYIDFLVT